MKILDRRDRIVDEVKALSLKSPTQTRQRTSGDDGDSDVKRDDDAEVDEEQLPVLTLEGRNQVKLLKLKVTDDLKVLKRIVVTSNDDLRRLRRSIVLSRKVAHPCILACEGALLDSVSSREV